MASSSADINVLLLGQTGVGKSTFVNSLVNHLIHGSLDEAMGGTIECLLPVDFSMHDPETFDLKKIKLGEDDNNEWFRNSGQSVTRGCRSHVFRIGNRKLRLIDTPGIGDTAGVRSDEVHVRNILDFLSQYQYLQAICILLKPNEERLTVWFRYCIQQLLTRLHTSAAKNIAFIFTNSQSTFYAVGSTAPLLRSLLTDIQSSYNSEIPFNRSNAFCIDNEGLRYAIASKFGIRCPPDEVRRYRKSWDESAKELIRFCQTIIKFSPHEVLDTQSINSAEQFLRLLARPMAEVSRLLTENIKLAKESNLQTRYYMDSSSSNHQLTQKVISSERLPFPRSVCTNQKCLELRRNGSGVEIEYGQICHNPCYLRKVQQDVIGDKSLLRCRAFEGNNGNCLECGCSYQQHMHISYENRIRFDVSNNLTPRYIHDHTEKLRKEQEFLISSSARFATFLNTHALLPFNDAFIDYVDLYIREEEMKKVRTGNRDDALEDLKQLRSQYQEEKKQYFASTQTQTDRMRASVTVTQSYEDITSSSIFQMIDKLYDLPISGKLIREQMNAIDKSQHKYTKSQENEVSLPNVRRDPPLMRELKMILNENDPQITLF